MSISIPAPSLRLSARLARGCAACARPRAPRPARPRAAAADGDAPAARAPHRAQKQRGRNLARPLSSMSYVCLPYLYLILCAFVFTYAHTGRAALYTLSTLATPGVCLFSAKQSPTAEATAQRTCAHTTSSADALLLWLGLLVSPAPLVPISLAAPRRRAELGRRHAGRHAERLGGERLLAHDQLSAAHRERRRR